MQDKIERLFDESAALMRAYNFRNRPAWQDAECGSAIERLLFMALWTRGEWRRRLVMAPTYAPDGWNADFPYTPVATPQMPWGPYRVDFMVSVPCPNGDTALFAIECDGHDFHERTKEQALRDRSRDRTLLQAGIQTLRFTGSEIWADAGRCADEVLAFIDQLYERNRIRSIGASV